MAAIGDNLRESARRFSPCIRKNRNKFCFFNHFFVPLQPQSPERAVDFGLGYGVMAAQEVLVLLVLVRIQVVQPTPRKPPHTLVGEASVFINISYLSASRSSNHTLAKRRWGMVRNGAQRCTAIQKSEPFDNQRSLKSIFPDETGIFCKRTRSWGKRNVLRRS